MWSLGILAYYLMTLTLPFDSPKGGPLAIMKNVCEKALPPIPASLGYTIELVNTVVKMLNKD